MSNEVLSALIDGECGDEELDRLLEAWQDDPALAQRWRRECLSRDARQGLQFAAPPACIVAGVMAAIEAAPAPLAKAPPATRTPSRSQWRRRAWRPVAGWAAAASMGAAAVLLLEPVRQADSAGAGPATFSPSVIVPVGESLPAGRARNLQAVSADAETLQAWPRSNDASSRQLQDFLMDHSSSMAEQGVGGTLRYARFAAHTADLRSSGEGR